MEYALRVVLAIALLMPQLALAQNKAVAPGLHGYTPTRIEWLTLLCNSSLRKAATTEEPFSMDIVSKDHETVLIYVRYFPTVNRELMKARIETARKVINVHAQSYAWDKWLKVKEDVAAFESR